MDCVQKTTAQLGFRAWGFAAALLVLTAVPAAAQIPDFSGSISTSGANLTPEPPPPSAAASQLADIFSQVGDEIYEECIFELSPEQLEVQHQLISAYIEQGAPSALARQLAVKQITPPQLTSRCQQIRSLPRGTIDEDGTIVEASLPADPAPEAAPWDTTLKVEVKPPPAKSKVAGQDTKAGKQNGSRAETPASETVLAALKDRKMLPMWDCSSNVDYVTISLNGFRRKLSGGEICKPFQDVVREVPTSAGSFKLGYTIRTGRLFVISDNAAIDGRTITWALSGRDVCRNNPDPECLAARAVGPLPPGEYSFASDKARRINWGPKTKRNVAGIWLRKLWNQDQYTPQQKKAILARGNIAIHVRLKGEMSEACIGMEPKGWAYVASLIKDGRATGVNVYIDEPHTQVAEAPPVIEGSSFSLTSLFK
ncbi:hypothetical protein APY04_1472 [Hyphomicrobium sulfonivorans]|uniref:Tlde1 domain-containing protein n=1 Tax=Hyphomicrobium sulfonivorans TaxID=121290 RepID=A0A125NVC9_HYPSL|nr:hypothetical protein APY04_1472 [Hyphomicrobium sulfonivorans]